MRKKKNLICPRCQESAIKVSLYSQDGGGDMWVSYQPIHGYTLHWGTPVRASKATLFIPHVCRETK